MEEKIKISLPQSTLDLLRKDCVDFGIAKKDSSPNMNLFINSLIMNFYESFCSNEEDLAEKLHLTLSALNTKEEKRIFSEIKTIINKREESSESKNSASLSFKPTKNSLSAFMYIESVISPEESISSFYRRMFMAYSSKTKTEREKIIFKKIFDLLKYASQKGLTVMIKLNNGNIKNNLSVYEIASSKDEVLNYLLAFDGKNNVTVRLSKIALVHIENEKANIPTDFAENFKRQIECGAQYPIYPSDNKPIKVQLTEKGKELFDRIYLYRPSPVSIEGNIYTFNCSANQALYYFERFGENALIISPGKLGVFMRNYYYFAYKKYKSQYRE